MYFYFLSVRVRLFAANIARWLVRFAKVDLDRKTIGNRWSNKLRFLFKVKVLHIFMCVCVCICLFCFLQEMPARLISLSSWFKGTEGRAGLKSIPDWGELAAGARTTGFGQESG